MRADLPVGVEGDWYERRHELEQDQIFRTYDGSIVKLDRGVAGDGTRWFVADWNQGFPGTANYSECKPHWSYEDSTIEPGDLRERLSAEDFLKLVSKATGAQ
jgi:hypothetical protein